MPEIVIHGARGRMGQAVRELVEAEEELDLVACLSRSSEDEASRPEHWDGRGEVVIDFSLPEGLRALVPLCSAHGVALVSGTTGLDAADDRLLDELATRVPVLTAANFSVGLLLVNRALEMLATGLPAGFDCEIIERHHRGKRDAPSGTALELARRVAAARGVPLDDVICYGRRGSGEPRPPGEIAVHSVRQGEIVGDHEVSFAGPGEVVSLVHRAQSRGVFARGAVLAARFVAQAPAGRYTLADALELS